MPGDYRSQHGDMALVLGEAVVALLRQQLQDVVQEFRIGVVGHVVLDVGCVY